MNMTPHGERIGDRIRQQLSNPSSCLSEKVRKWNNWKHLAKTEPKTYEIVWDDWNFELRDKTLGSWINTIEETGFESLGEILNPVVPDEYTAYESKVLAGARTQHDVRECVEEGMVLPMEKDLEVLLNYQAISDKCYTECMKILLGN